MKLLLLHLSDIHISASDDPILERQARIVAAVRNLTQDLDLCVLALSGDITFSGTGDQFGLAANFLGDLRDLLGKALGGSVRVETVVIPGNHDCNFQMGGGVRDILIDRIATSGAQPIAMDVACVCTEVLNEFLHFSGL